jgi:nucleoside-diphosphate-sugar epimerase
METNSPGLRADVEAFMRPAPVEQPRLKDLQSSVDPKRYQGVKALIVGGSRGLGEVTAKILAAGGAEVAITYATGFQEAQILAEEFAERNLRLRILAFDARMSVSAQLSKLPFHPTHVFYFATSKIYRQTDKLYRQDLFDEFVGIYVTAFFEICEFFSGGRPVKVFYPSSVFVEERPRDMTEYAMAKSAGEALCNDINRFMTGVSVLQRRLPRLATDQTATVTAVESVSSVDVLREIVDTLCPSMASAD